MNLGGGLELDVVYWSAGGLGGFDVPDLLERVSEWERCRGDGGVGRILKLTGVHLATYDHFDLAKPGADDGAVLSVVVDDLLIPGLNVLP